MTADLNGPGGASRTASPPSRSSCPHCEDQDESALDVARTEVWRVVHGPPDATRAGGLKIISQRHFTDFAEMNPAEQAQFGTLLHTLDVAFRQVTGAERVHLVSTRDRVPHFHAWLYPRYAEDELRGTAFLNAPQTTSPGNATRISERLATAVAKVAMPSSPSAEG